MESFKKHSFDIQQSPVKEAYRLLSAQEPFDLDRKYVQVDQILMKSGEWDYDNDDLLINKVKKIIESAGLERISNTEEYEWCSEILWFWYHHAISCALWKHKDKEKALEVSAKALELKSNSNPNKITAVLYFLVRDDVSSAVKVANDDLNDKDTALQLIEEYKAGEFFV